VTRAPEPREGGEREQLLGWLAFHRDALEAKCRDLRPEDLIRTGLGGSAMSLLGLVRHMTEMERVYLTFALDGSRELELVYGPYEEGQPAGDFDDLTVDMVGPSFGAWHGERAHADALIASVSSLDEAGPGRRRSLRTNLLKVIQEYARHNGHADLIRESIDGMVGE
jgi:hypothetical protein